MTARKDWMIGGAIIAAVVIAGVGICAAVFASSEPLYSAQVSLEDTMTHSVSVVAQSEVHPENTPRSVADLKNLNAVVATCQKFDNSWTIADINSCTAAVKAAIATVQHDTKSSNG